MKYQKILFFIIILIIISLLTKYTENFDNTLDSTSIYDTKPQTQTKPDVYYTDIIDYKKYYDIDTQIQKNLTTIPKIIIQTWKTDYIPEKYVKEIKSLKNTNPDYTFIYFNDLDIENFLSVKYPEYYSVYKKLPIKIQKIDFFRYIAVYHYGGFYFDLDITGLLSLDSLLNYQCIFPIDQHLICSNPKQRIKPFCDKNMKWLLGQYALGAKIQDPFIKKLIDTITKNIDLYIEQYENNKNNNEQYVYNSTGPDFVTEVYYNYPNKGQIYILPHKYGQNFGIYAKHNHYGTWK
jgi:mannosyltransferase OCH1-like enzyme